MQAIVVKQQRRISAYPLGITWVGAPVALFRVARPGPVAKSLMSSTLCDGLTPASLSLLATLMCASWRVIRWCVNCGEKVTVDYSGYF